MNDAEAATPVDGIEAIMKLAPVIPVLVIEEIAMLARLPKRWSPVVCARWR